MINYFKDKKFRLSYLDMDGGIPIYCIPTIFINNETKKSQVIAARAGPLSHSSNLSSGISIDVMFTEGSESIKTKFEEIYEHISSLSNNEREIFLALNYEKSESILNSINIFEGVTVNRLLILSENDGIYPEDPSNSDWTIKEIKEGGSELVIDFLLSRFCRYDEYEWVRRDDPSVKFSPSYDLEFSWSLTDSGMSQAEEAEHKRVPVYNLSNNATLDDLIEYEKYFDDDDFDWVRATNDYYYLNVVLDKLSKLTDMINIPQRILGVLTAEQKTQLDTQVPQILLGNLDYIVRSVLNQRVDSYSDDQASKYQSMHAQQWGSDMYEILGGDGEGNAYMSDGLSITPDGRIVDD